MPATLARVFRTINNQSGFNNTSGMPVLNEITTSLNDFYIQTGQYFKRKRLMAWYKTIPELTAFVNKVARDATSQFHFEPIKPSDSSRNKLLEANRFVQEVLLKETNEQIMTDMLITGDGFAWIGKLTNDQIKTKLKEIIKNEVFLERKEKKRMEEEIFNLLSTKQVEGFNDLVGLDEDLRKPRKYRYVAATTVEIKHDAFDVLGYVQRVGTSPPVPFDTKDLIHYTLMQRDGKISGYTPIEAIVVQLELLRQMWQNMLSIHKNGGTPDKMFVLENAQISSPSFKRIEQQLQQYKLVENKHGNMVFAGKVTVQDLQQLDEMQFKDSGLYITGLIAMQWGIPRSAIPYIIGGTNLKEDTGGSSERSYWSTIRSFQDTFANIQNTQLWIPHFGVKIVYDNQFINLDVQRETALQLKLNNVIAMDNILAKAELQLGLPKRLRLLHLTDEDVEEQIMIEESTGSLDKQLSDDEVNDSEDTANQRVKKRDEQVQNITQSGVSPTGVGKEIIFKEFDKDAEIEYKQIIGNDAQQVSFRMFVKLYNEDKAYHPGVPPRVFMVQNMDLTTFKFKSSDFVYRTIITNEELEQNQVLFMNLDNIHRL